MSSLLDAKRNSIQTYEHNKVNITARFQIRLMCFVLLDNQLFSIHSTTARNECRNPPCRKGTSGPGSFLSPSREGPERST